MPSMSTLTDRYRLVGRIVRDEIDYQGVAITEAARQWHMSRPTLYRLMDTGVVGARFYRAAERHLGLPRGLFDLVIDGDTEGIRGLRDLAPHLQDMILTQLGDDPPRTDGRRRRARS
jgi:hypothetical protein